VHRVAKIAGKKLRAALEILLPEMMSEGETTSKDEGPA
jgi:hypothetical protein